MAWLLVCYCSNFTAQKEMKSISIPCNVKWLSTSAVKAKRHRRRLERRWKQLGSEEDCRAYRQARQDASKQIACSKLDYLRSQLADVDSKL